jgi:hypothetical protein
LKLRSKNEGNDDQVGVGDWSRQLVMTSSASAQSAAVSRGDYLVNTIMTCSN